MLTVQTAAFPVRHKLFFTFLTWGLCPPAQSSRSSTGIALDCVSSVNQASTFLQNEAPGK